MTRSSSYYSSLLFTFASLYSHASNSGVCLKLDTEHSYRNFEEIENITSCQIIAYRTSSRPENALLLSSSKGVKRCNKHCWVGSCFMVAECSDALKRWADVLTASDSKKRFTLFETRLFAFFNSFDKIYTSIEKIGWLCFNKTQLADVFYPFLPLFSVKPLETTAKYVGLNGRIIPQSEKVNFSISLATQFQVKCGAKPWGKKASRLLVIGGRPTNYGSPGGKVQRRQLLEKNRDSAIR